jgi:hypothetical protein
MHVPEVSIMSRLFFAFAAVFAALSQAQGQTDTALTIKLSIRPQGPPTPSLRYRLLPSLSEQKPENGAELYKKAAEMLMRIRDREDFAKLELFLDLKKCPKPEYLPRDEVRQTLERYTGVLKMVDEAARCERCDWDLAHRLRISGVNAPLPEIQPLRSIATLLSARARLAMAEGRLDDALRDIQTGLAMGHQIGEAPVLICSLVGVAVSSIMCVRLEELIERDKAPNLYWAIADLPRPFISLRLPLQGERLAAYASFPGGAEAAADLKATLKEPAKAIDVLKIFEALSEGRRDELVDRALPNDVVKGIRKYDMAMGVLARYEVGKKALINAGRPTEIVEKMSPLEVEVLHGLLEYDRALDEVSHWQAFPFWEAYPKVRDYMEKVNLDRELSGADAAALPLARLLLPALEKVYVAQMRLDRRLAAIRCVEAIRIHAAAHDGKGPAKLEDIKEVPVPVDPATGRLFEYTVKDDQAILYGPPLDKKDKPNMANAIRLELHLR